MTRSATLKESTRFTCCVPKCSTNLMGLDNMAAHIKSKHPKFTDNNTNYKEVQLAKSINLKEYVDERLNKGIYSLTNRLVKLL